jgi:hypothetical protein
LGRKTGCEAEENGQIEYKKVNWTLNLSFTVSDARGAGDLLKLVPLAVES